MRAMRIPIFILLVLVVISMAHSVTMTRRCRDWLDTVDRADAAAAQGDWDEAEDLLQQLQEDWEPSRVWLRITISHTTLDNAKSLLEQAQLLARLQEEAHTRATLAELSALLRQMDEGERLSWENIL